jgi:propionyl-CoA carboxylase alpha chain
MSENAEFSKQVTDMGVAWLGPSPYAVRDMGDKLMSKRLAQEAGVHIIPGYDSPMENVDHALQVANDIGYPILLKAQAGGGGKGMRVCRSDAEVIETFPMATEEGLKFFKDPRLLCEKFVSIILTENSMSNICFGCSFYFFLFKKQIDDPHHIEFQVLAGAKGKTSVELANLTSPIDPDELDILVFPERECSIQRRHQKVIEESPSVLLTEETRLKMVEQVKALVRQVGYTSAGTVEWLVDSTPEQVRTGKALISFCLLFR